MEREAWLASRVYKRHSRGCAWSADTRVCIARGIGRAAARLFLDAQALDKSFLLSHSFPKTNQHNTVALLLLCTEGCMRWRGQREGGAVLD
jgi:hypothetical protein